MKKLTAIFAAALIAMAATLPVFASAQSVFTDNEIISSFYDEANDGYDIIVSWGQYVYVVAENTYKWYYTSCPAFYEISEFSSDGSEAGDKMLAAVQNHEPIPVGTPVDLVPYPDSEVFINETYPPQLGAAGIMFVGEGTSEYTISKEAMITEIDGINRCYTFEGWYPYPDGSYPDASVAVNGTLYRMVRDENGRPHKVDENIDTTTQIVWKTSGYSDGEPRNNGEQNTADWLDIEYTELSEPGFLAVRTNSYHEWTLFEAYKTLENENAGKDGDSTAPNPETGTAMPSLALAGVAVWLICARLNIRDK